MLEGSHRVWSSRTRSFPAAAHRDCSVTSPAVSVNLNLVTGTRGKKTAAATAHPGPNVSSEYFSGLCFEREHPSHVKGLHLLQLLGPGRPPWAARRASAGLRAARAPSRWAGASSSCLILLAWLFWNKWIQIENGAKGRHASPRTATGSVSYVPASVGLSPAGLRLGCACLLSKRTHKSWKEQEQDGADLNSGPVSRNSRKSPLRLKGLFI